MGIVADRFMYIPSLGFSIVIAYLILTLFKVNPKNEKIPSTGIVKVLVVLVLILIPYTAMTISRNKEWKNQVTLLQADIDNLKTSAKANLIYSGTMKGEVMKAIRGKDKNKRKLKKQIDDIIEH